MVKVVVGGKVDPEVKARLIKEAGANGKTVNAVIRDLVNDYLDEKNKLAHPTEYAPDEKSEKLVIVPPENDVPDEKSEKLVIVPSEDEINELEYDKKTIAKEILSEMWDTFRDYVRDRGYTLVKTDSLKKILAYLKPKIEANEKDEFECPVCHYTADKKFKYCPRCDRKLTWED